jgi:succinoglycan biosynthesis protein ExoO
MPTNQPLISIVMPAFNAAETIVSAILSVVTGTMDAFELIVCNDASTDATSEAVRSINDKRIRLFENSTNLGEGRSRDRAINAAKGQWITLLDADDLYAPTRLARLLEVGLAYPDAIIFDEIMQCHDVSGEIVLWRPVRQPTWCNHNTAQRIPIEQWMLADRTLLQPMIPTALIRKYDIHHPRVRYGADLGFMLDLLGHSRAPLWYVPEALYLYRLSAGSMSTVPERYSLLADVLDGAEPLFDWNPAMQAAIRAKVYNVRRAMAYQPFFSAMMHGKIGAAAREAAAHPWVLREFAKRAAQRIPYHISRLRHRGARRETA